MYIVDACIAYSTPFRNVLVFINHSLMVKQVIDFELFSHYCAAQDVLIRI